MTMMEMLWDAFSDRFSIENPKQTIQERFKIKHINIGKEKKEMFTPHPLSSKIRHVS